MAFLILSSLLGMLAAMGELVRNLCPLRVGFNWSRSIHFRGRLAGFDGGTDDSQLKR
jgi:hypothetical protein